ncbi:hypothetical protein, partial [Streptomyces europaeiscabiei]|uniref:hypothetical protein n=1 Tax=Streptomyces europaeiscabiei TaxID=146819 RepID=UPI0029B79F2D
MLGQQLGTVPGAMAQWGETVHAPTCMRPPPPSWRTPNLLGASAAPRADAGSMVFGTPTRPTDSRRPARQQGLHPPAYL